MASAELKLVAPIRTAPGPFLVHAARIALATCLGHWMFWLWIVFAGYMTAVAIDHPPAPVWMWPFLTLYTGGLVPILFAEHLVSDRSQLVPNYRKVHVLAMAIAGVTLVGAITALLSGFGRSPIWPMSGLALLAFSLGGWTIGRRLLVVVFVSGIVTATLANFDWAPWIREFAQRPQPNLCLGLIGCLLLFSLLRWFWSLNEDSSGFENCRQVAAHSRFVVRTPRRHYWAQPGAAQGSGQKPLRWPMALAYRPQDWLLEAGIRSGRRVPGWSVLRWKLASPGALLVACQVTLGFWIVLLPLALITASLSGWESAWPILGAAATASLVIVQVALILVPHLERRTLVGYESLRPVTRNRMLRQWGAAVLWQILVGSLLLSVLFLSLMSFDGGYPDPLSATIWAFYQLAALFLYTGMVLLLRTFGGEVLQGLSGFVGTILFGYAVATLAVFLAQVGSLLLVAATATALTAAGAVILYIAYRRWLVRDLE